MAADTATDMAAAEAELKQRLGSIIGTAIRNRQIGGANLLVIRHGHDVVDLAAGTARTDGTPYARNTILRLYSQTKPITATATMMLVERGLLDLDAPVSDILPEYAGLRVLRADAGTVESGLPEELADEAAKDDSTAETDKAAQNDSTANAATDASADADAENVSRETSSPAQSARPTRPATEPVSAPLTVRNLLTMTSGLVYPSSANAAGQASARIYADLEGRLRTDHEMTTREFARRFAAAPLHFQPGSHWEYGTSADILGAVIEEVSGERFGDFLRENIFKPLGMKDTGFWVPEDKRDRLADIWENPGNPLLPGNEGQLRFLHVDHLGINYTADHAPAFESGGAGLFSTLDDYARFARMLLGHGTFVENDDTRTETTGDMGDIDGRHDKTTGTGSRVGSSKTGAGVRLLSPASVDYMTHDALTPAQHGEYEQWQAGCGYNCLMRVVRDPSRTNHLCFAGDYGWDGWLGTYFMNIPSRDAVFLIGLQRTNTGTVGLTRQLRNVVSAYLAQTE
jgi:CubicO group peptidase (beta-lactamase class C family)